MTAAHRLGATDVTITVDGAAVTARAGESVAAALAASGPWPSFYCGMGVCHACLVAIDGIPGHRACLAPVAPGMRVERSGWEGRFGRAR